MKLFSTLALLVALTFTTPVHANMAEERCPVFATVVYKVGVFRDQGVPADVVFYGLVQNGLPVDMALKLIDLVYLALPDISPVDIANEYHDQCVKALTTY